MFLYISIPALIYPPFGVVFGTFIVSEDKLERFLYLQVFLLYLVFISDVFNTSSRSLMAASAASDSKTLFLASLSLTWVVLHSCSLRMRLSSISLLWASCGITISVLTCNSIVMSWPVAIPIFWTGFSHFVHISSADFFSPYVNIEFPRALDRPDLDFSFLELSCYPLPLYLTLPIPELLTLLELPPLPEPPLRLFMAVDFCQSY